MVAGQKKKGEGEGGEERGEEKRKGGEGEGAEDNLVLLLSTEIPRDARVNEKEL